MKTLLRNKTHIRDRSHDMHIVQKCDKKIKLTYQAYNACEQYVGEVFDGTGFQTLFVMIDLGVVPNSSIYIHSEKEREQRVDTLYKLAVKFIDVLIK